MNVTEQAFQDAFKELLVETDYESVTAKAICAKAGLSRSTFSRCYSDMESLVISIMKEDLFNPTRAAHELLASLKHYGASTLLLERSYSAFYENRDFYSKVIAGLSKAWFIRQYMKLSSQEFADQNLYSDVESEIERDFLYTHFSGVGATTLIWWLESDFPLKPDEMADMVNKWCYAAFNQNR